MVRLLRGLDYGELVIAMHRKEITRQDSLAGRLIAWVLGPQVLSILGMIWFHVPYFVALFWALLCACALSDALFVRMIKDSMLRSNLLCISSLCGLVFGTVFVSKCKLEPEQSLAWLVAAVFVFATNRILWLVSLRNMAATQTGPTTI